MARTRRVAARRSLVLVVGFVLLAGSAHAQVRDALPGQDPPAAGATPHPDAPSPVASSPPFRTPRHPRLVPFCRATALGIGGFALACVALSPSRDARQIAPLPDRLPAPSGRKWLTSIHVATPAISVTRVF